MATTKKTAEKKPAEKKVDARDVLDSGTGNELTAIAVKSLTNIEEKLDAVDWKLWEIYNIVKNYVESAPISAPQVSQPQASATDIAKTLGEEPEPKKSVVGKLFGK